MIFFYYQKRCAPVVRRHTAGWRALLLLVLGALLQPGLGAWAQAPAAGGAPAAGSGSAAPAPAEKPVAAPTKTTRPAPPTIQNIHATADPAQDTLFKLGSSITLEVKGLADWLNHEEQSLVERGMSQERAHSKTRQMVLYIDDTPLRNMPPLAVYLDGSRSGSLVGTSDTDTSSTNFYTIADSLAHADLNYDKVIFKLDRTPANQQYWDIVYGSPWKFTHPGKIGLGYDDQVFTELYPGLDRSVHLQLVQPVTLWIAAIGVLLLALGIMVLSRRSALLRSGKEGDLASAGVPLDSTLRPYSLAKTQLAWWTFIIMGSYLVIYCVTGEMPTISMTTLSLLGISAGTAGLSGLIGGPGDVGKPLAGTPTVSQGWLTDILSDSNGISINRLQKIIITLLLGYFFVRTVYKTVAMPEWNDNEILLLAISNATYLGLKWQSNHAGLAGALGALASPGTTTTTISTPGATVSTTTPATAPTQPPATILAPATVAATAGESVADPVTGSVLHREEDDMGPESAGPEDDAPAPTEQIPG